MKIHLPWGRSTKKGKAKTIYLVGEELDKRGYSITYETPQGCDISIGHHVFHFPETKAKKILRLNGCPYYSSDDDREHLKRVIDNIKIADGIIYESEFSKMVWDECAGKPDVPYRVIRNCDIVDVHKGKNVDKIPGWEYEFIAVASWRKLKNLKATIEAVLKFEGAGLHIYGNVRDPDEIVKDKRIKYYGHKGRGDIYARARNCVAALHLATIDWCPNSVVELLSVGCPVVCANNGGGAELIREGCGKIVDVYPSFDRNHNYNDDVMPIDIDKVVGAMRECVGHPVVTNTWHINVANIATQYVEFFEEVLSGSS